MSRHRGALIVLEGVDKVGKSTQANKLVESLKSLLPSERFELFKFPDRNTPIGQLINKYLMGHEQLDDHVIHLLFSANRWEHNNQMKKLINSGTNLIIDRYAYSGVAYTSAKQSMDLTWCKSSDVGLPQPDIVIYLELPNQHSFNRNGFGDEVYERNHFQEKVKTQFRKLIDQNWKIISADKSIDQVHQELISIVTETIKEVQKKNDCLKSLWSDEI